MMQSLRVRAAGVFLLTLASFAALPPAAAGAVSDVSAVAEAPVAPDTARWYNCVDEVREDWWWGPRYVSAFLGPDYAKDFGWQAARNGWAVDGSPQVGDVAVFPGGVHGSDWTGHVSLVIGVGDGTITIRERGSRPPGSVRYGLAVLPGIEFVHRYRLADVQAPQPAPAPEPSVAVADGACASSDGSESCATAEDAPTS
ncbi:MAG: CHAP domain-containing protein [Chloroflexi bacterium]|nr:CHAP domain-containing protein [Chloroflexota bacterium]